MANLEWTCENLKNWLNKNTFWSALKIQTSRSFTRGSEIIRTIEAKIAWIYNMDYTKQYDLWFIFSLKGIYNIELL